MSYAIIRHEKYKLKNLAGIYRHNERKNTNYSNKDIKKEYGIKNYWIKKSATTYEKSFELIRKKYNLKGQIKKVSNIACEYIITSDKEFFDSIGEEETKRYFETAYEFVTKYKNLGEQYIISAKVHLDETTPHMHLVYIPVVHTKDKKGKTIDKIGCSEFWKERNSYTDLQDKFYEFVTSRGFYLERGDAKDNEHINIETLKDITEYDNLKYELQREEIVEHETNNVEELKRENKRLVKYCNTLRGRYIKAIKSVDRCIELQEENNNLRYENEELKSKNKKLTNYINNIFEVVRNIFKIPKEKIINEIKKIVL